MPSPRAEFSRRAVRWFLPTALFALAPKCLLCVGVYAGLGAFFGLGGPEICGAPAAAPAGWAPWLAAAGIGLVVGLRARHRARRGVRPSAD